MIISTQLFRTKFKRECNAGWVLFEWLVGQCETIVRALSLKCIAICECNSIFIFITAINSCCQWPLCSRCSLFIYRKRLHSMFAKHFVLWLSHPFRFFCTSISNGKYSESFFQSNPRFFLDTHHIHALLVACFFMSICTNTKEMRESASHLR